MKKKLNNRFCVVVTAVFALLASPSAFAYLDPTTGSMVISAIVGIFASIALALKTYWYKVKTFFKGGSQPEPEDKDRSESSAD